MPSLLSSLGPLCDRGQPLLHFPQTEIERPRQMDRPRIIGPPHACRVFHKLMRHLDANLFAPQSVLPP